MEIRQPEFTRKEVARRSDELLEHFISRPPQPHATHHPGKTRMAKAIAGRRKGGRREKRASAS